MQPIKINRSEWNRDWVGGPLKDHCGLKWKPSTEAVYRKRLSRLCSLSKLRSQRFPASQLHRVLHCGLLSIRAVNKLIRKADFMTGEEVAEQTVILTTLWAGYRTGGRARSPTDSARLLQKLYSDTHVCLTETRRLCLTF